MRILIQMVVLMLLCACYPFQLRAQQAPQLVAGLPDPPQGVTVWKAKSQNQLPRFFEQLGTNVQRPPNGDPHLLPWGRSVAFLVGVGPYKDHRIDTLGGVTHSLQKLRDYLQNEGGFDVIYEIDDTGNSPNPAGNPASVKHMMNNVLYHLNADDRLLFYFAGHGTNENGVTGYMVFRNASPDEIDENYLPTTDIREWSARIHARSILFILDSCSAGYGFSQHQLVRPVDPPNILQLGEKPSRYLLTAGTGDQPTFDTGKGKQEMTVFGRALTDALQQSVQKPSPNVMFTVEHLLADIQDTIIQFHNSEGETLKPQIYPLDSAGDFLFLNPAAKSSVAGTEVIKQLYEVNASTVGVPKMLQLRSAAQTQLTIDPVAAYTLASKAYSLSPDVPNKRLVFSAASSIGMFYSDRIRGYKVEDHRGRFLLLRATHPGESGLKQFAVFDTETHSTQELDLSAEKAWIAPVGDSWRVISMNGTGDGPVQLRNLEYQLWDSSGKRIGEPVSQEGNESFLTFVDNNHVSVPGYDAGSEIFWDLSADARSLTGSDIGNKCVTSFPRGYSPLAIRKDGTAAVSCDDGITLMNPQSLIQMQFLTHADFNPTSTTGTWSADGLFLALTDSTKKSLGIWSPSLKTFRWLGLSSTDRLEWQIDAYCWSRDGHSIAYAGRSNVGKDVEVQVKDASGETSTVVYQGGVPVTVMTFVDNDRQLALGLDGGNIKQFDLKGHRVPVQARHPHITDLFAVDDRLYSGSEDEVLIWSGKVAPSEYWNFTSSEEIKYDGLGAADRSWNWLAVPFRGKVKTGIELREIPSGKSRLLDFSREEIQDVAFSDDSKWLVVEQMSAVTVMSLTDTRAYRFEIQAIDLDFTGLKVEKDVVVASAATADALDGSEYTIKMSGEYPSLSGRTQTGPIVESGSSGTTAAAIKDDIDGWYVGSAYYYRHSIIKAIPNVGFSYYAKCNSEKQTFRDCDLQFIPTDADRVRGLYDAIVWRPTSAELEGLVE